MKKNLFNSKLFKVTLTVAGLLFTTTIFAQTITINNGETLDASGQATATLITINAGGTLNMDAPRTYGNITTAGTGISTISGTSVLTITNTFTVGANNTLAVAPDFTATNFNCGNGSTVEYKGGDGQAVRSANYYNLTLAGTGAKTFSGDQTITGNFLLENGASLTLGSDSLIINVNGDRNAIINGTLNINGDGRLTETGNGTKTLVMGSGGYLGITDNGGTNLTSLSFDAYNLNASSTVEYGSTDDQTITDVPSPGYGNLIISGGDDGDTKTALGGLDIQGDLTISSGTFDAIHKTHNLKGNWIKNGGVFIGTGRINFNGAAAQTIGGTESTSFYRINFANTNGGISLTKPITITRRANFISGIVTSDAINVLIFTDGSTSSLTPAMATTSSYVNGPVRKVGNNVFTFPIGAATGFVPLTMSAPNNATDEYTAQYFRGVPVDHTNITAAGIDHISTCDYWDLNLTTEGGTAATINATFYWNANNPCGGPGSYVTDPATVRAVHYTGGSWSEASAGFGTGSNSAGSVILAGLTTFGPLALASTSAAANPLPVVFADVKAYGKNNGVQIEWSNLTEKDVAEYTIERSANGRDFSAIGKQLPTSNQNDKASYDAFDATPGAGANYYRIKAEETTGKIVYSKILSVDLGKTNQGLKLYPNPVSGNQVTVSLSNVKRGQYNLRVINTAGQDIFKQIINNQSSSLTQTLDLPSTVKPGVYNLVVTGDDYRESKMFIVQ